MANEIISKISKGSKMDQIYIPKNRIGFVLGEYVVIHPLEERLKEKTEKKLNFYGIKEIEPLKLSIIENIVDIIENKANLDNLIITGSFLDKGFKFNDIDILLISNNNINTDLIKENIENKIGIKAHLIALNNKSLLYGLSTDPLYNMMLSRFISTSKMIFDIKRDINYKLLDLNLLKSKILIDNFSLLNGNEKYYLTLNMISILMFMQNKKLSKEIVEKEIERQFNIKINELRENLIEREFIKKYKEIFNTTFSIILNNIKEMKNAK